MEWAYNKFNFGKVHFTVFIVWSRIDAVTSIRLFSVTLWHLFEHGLYLRAAFIHFFSHCNAYVNPLHCSQICLKLCKVFEKEFFYFFKLFGVVAMAETGTKKVLRKC